MDECGGVANADLARREIDEGSESIIDWRNRVSEVV